MKTKTAVTPVTATSMAAAIEAVRASGGTNMFDRTHVLILMGKLGYRAEAQWLGANLGAYGPMLMRGDYSALPSAEPPAGSAGPTGSATGE